MRWVSWVGEVSGLVRWVRWVGGWVGEVGGWVRWVGVRWVGG